MKFLAFFLALLVFTTVSAKVRKENHEEESIDREIKVCLATVYTAEKANYMDLNEYTSDPNFLGLDSKCSKMVKAIDVYPRENFKAYAALKNRIWTINEKKELILLAK